MALEPAQNIVTHEYCSSKNLIGIQQLLNVAKIKYKIQQPQPRMFNAANFSIKLLIINLGVSLRKLFFSFERKKKLEQNVKKNFEEINV